MIERLRTFSLARRHPRSEVFSRYLDDELDAAQRRALESHVGDCPHCRNELARLANAIRALGSLGPETPSGLADSIIAAVRAEGLPGRARGSRASHAANLPALTVVPGSAQPSAGEPGLNRWSQEARTSLRWCLQRPRLRLTLPIAVITGVVLTMVNMGGMLMHGKIDLGVCLSCAVDFLVPFVALNLGLLMLLRLPSRTRP